MSDNRQTCFADLPKVIIPVSCYLCMCVYMNVCVSCCINVCCLVSKIMKEIAYIEWNISSRKAQHPFALGLHFQGQTFCFLFVLRISCGWWKIEKTLLLPSHRKSCFCHRIAQLWILHIVTLTYISKVTKFMEIYNIYKYGKLWELAKNAQVRL